MGKLAEDQKQQMIEMIKEGSKTKEEIAQLFGVTLGTVGSHKAHVTMGTYDEWKTKSEEVEEIRESIDTKFGLEKDMQLALRDNIEQLEKGLKIIDGGKEQHVEAGYIDIAAKDKNNKLVIIELKAGTAVPQALTQLLAYMGTIPREAGQDVRGILVAHDFDSKIRFAVRGIPNVTLKKYSFKFTFNSPD